MLPQAKTRRCDAEERNCVSPFMCHFSLGWAKNDTRSIEQHWEAKVLIGYEIQALRNSCESYELR